MTTLRKVATTGAAFLVSQVLAVAVHGFILSKDYEPFYGTLLRKSSGGSWQMLLLPVAHLFFVSALVWVYARVVLQGGTFIRGLKLGVLGWMLGQAPLWLLWYAEQPWPGELVAKQLALEFLSSLVIGVTIAGTARETRARDMA